MVAGMGNQVERHALRAMTFGILRVCYRIVTSDLASWKQKAQPRLRFCL
jgi:hypothetical protein